MLYFGFILVPEVVETQAVVLGVNDFYQALLYLPHFRGVGLALMHASIGAADALDEPLIALLGSTVYYARYGFVHSTTLGITAPDPAWGAHFQVRPLTAYRPDVRGQFRYASPFDSL